MSITQQYLPSNTHRDPSYISNIQSFDSKDKMTESIHQPNSRNRPTNNSQYLYNHLIEFRVIALINDIDRLNFSHKHNPLKRIAL